MNKYKMIEFAKEQCEIFPEYSNMGKYLRETLKMLQAEPCEDAISRADAKKYLSAPDANGDYVIYESDLDLLPPVTPTRKKGKWVTKFHGFPPEPYTACSNCDYDIDFEISKLVKADAFTIKPYRPKFCPNCGAEMENKE